MKLLEVDEAANHIRELVDPNANIIWGSAFNPDLQGKIRVSVVATGIEQSAEQAVEAANKPMAIGASRGPVRPGLVAPATEAQPLFERGAPPVAASAPAPEIAAAPTAAPAAVAPADDIDSMHDWDEEAGRTTTAIMATMPA